MLKLPFVILKSKLTMTKKKSDKRRNVSSCGIWFSRQQLAKKSENISEIDKNICVRDFEICFPKRRMKTLSICSKF